MRWNGTTWLDRTNYYELFEASGDNLKWAIEMEADRMVHSNIARKDLDPEMTVVRNEFENGENSPFSVMLKRTQSIAFDWHNYGHATIGNRSDIENVKTRESAGVLPHLLSTRQRSAAGGRQIRPGANPGLDRPRIRTRLPSRRARCRSSGRSSRPRMASAILSCAAKAIFRSSMSPTRAPARCTAIATALGFAGQILADTPNGRLHKLLVESGKAAEVFHYGLNGYAPGLQIIGAVVKKGEPGRAGTRCTDRRD